MPKVVDHQERRAAIARAAWEAIAMSGLADVTMKDIARAAGVTTGAVTHYFASKDDILAAALEQVAGATLERLRTGRVNSVGDFLELVGTAMPTTPALRDEWRVWLGFWARTVARRDDLATHNQRFRVAWLAVVQKRLSELQSTNEINADEEPSVLASRISHVVHGIALEACLDPDGWPAGRQHRELAALLGPVLRSER